MVQAYFGNLRSYDDLGLTLTKAVISSAEPKRMLVDVPGMNGQLEMSGAVAQDIKFKNRKLTMDFTMKDYQKNWTENFSRINNAVHGKHFRITLDNDPRYYWEGLCTVSRSEDDRNKGEVEVIADVYPYKHRDIRIQIESAETETELICPCGRESVWPVVTTDGNITITMEDETQIQYDAGTWQKRDLMFTEGPNLITVSGEASVTIEYKEGVL